jgi:hypothetical protein
MKKRYATAIELKEETILKKNFFTLRAAERWACKTVRTICVCDSVATIIDSTTGEIMAIISKR